MTNLPSRLRDLAETLDGCQWEHPLCSAETCRLAADELERLSRAWGVTADGVPFSNGSKVYYVDPCGFVQGLDVGLKFRTDDSVPSEVYRPYPIYSTPEAAAPAAKEKQS